MRTIDRIIWRNLIGAPAWGTISYMTGFAIAKCVRREWAWAVTFAGIALAFLIVSLISYWMKPRSKIPVR